MSSPKQIPDVQAMNNDIISGSPSRGQTHAHANPDPNAHPHAHFLIPSPIPTRRSRTYSACERAEQGPVLQGKVKNFCRQRGHGFVTPADGSTPLFVHISDVDGEYVPVEGDEVTYKTVLIPPRLEKMQAVHVKITHLNPQEKHEKWDSSNTC